MLTSPDKPIDEESRNRDPWAAQQQQLNSHLNAWPGTEWLEYANGSIDRPRWGSIDRESLEEYDKEAQWQ